MFNGVLVKKICFTFLVASILFAYFAYKAEARRAGIYISALPPLCESMGEYDAQKCKNSPAIRRLGCDDIKPPPQYWGGLRPHLPMAICQNFRGSATGPAISVTGCKMAVRERYIVMKERNGEYDISLLGEQEEFRRYFAPIENDREAISYISALTGAYPKYDFPEKYFIRSMDEDGKYTTNNPKPTEVKEKKDGFDVRLFDHTRCGCHRPTLYEINYFVSKNGSIRELNRKKIWEANRRYNICID